MTETCEPSPNPPQLTSSSRCLRPSGERVKGVAIPNEHQLIPLMTCDPALTNMSPRLKPLLLPRLVEQRRRRESMSELEDLSCSTYSQSSTDAPSPLTPTFSSRGHLRYPSSASSVESSFHSSVVSDRPSSPPCVATKAGKRCLPDVQEELEKEEEDFDMLDDANELYNCLCDSSHCLHRGSSMAQSSVQSSTPPNFDHDSVDGFFSDGEFAVNSKHKKRRANETAFNEIATRLETRFPSFSRRWRLRKASNAASIVCDTQHDAWASRAASSRSSSISNLARQDLDAAFEMQLPPTPTKSIFEDTEALSPAMSIDIEKANKGCAEVYEPMATTPLLPPLMMCASSNTNQILVQSPLQSPSVAEPSDAVSGTVSPVDAMRTPHGTGLPSPPLSTKPSISSFHATTNRPGHLVPTSEIPPIVMADPNDEWANKLGHANFTIYPEPYIPETFDLEACRQLRTQWDVARCNYTKHLVRTGEHYGVTSTTYKLTCEKWDATDAVWRQNNHLTIANTVDNSSGAFATLKQHHIGDATNVNLMTKIPSLNDPRSGGKFPQLGDEDIVGPMVRAAAQSQRSPTKKTKFLRFFAQRFPVGLGRF